MHLEQQRPQPLQDPGHLRGPQGGAAAGDGASTSQGSAHRPQAQPSRGHSLPMIDGEEQRAGASARSQVLACATSPEQVSFDGQLAPCYPPACGCRSLIRTLQLDRHAGVLQLIDQFHLHQACAVEVGTIVPAAVEAAGDGAQLLLGERHVTIRPLEGTHLVAIEPLRFTGHTGLPEQASRLVWKPLFVSLRPRIGIEIRSR